MKQNPLNMMPNNGGRYYGFATKWDNLLLGMGRANVLPLQQRECASY